MSKPATVAICALLVSQAGFAAGKYLDVIAEISLSTSQTSDVGRQITAHEDWIVGIQCTDRVRLVRSVGTYWRAATDQNWETLVQVDGKTIAIKEGHIPKGKELGTTTSSQGLFGSQAKHHGDEIEWRHGMVFWKPAGQGLGTHEIRCLANQTRTLSDNTETNNAAIGLVEVVPAKPKPAQQPPAVPPPRRTGKPAGTPDDRASGIRMPAPPAAQDQQPPSRLAPGAAAPSGAAPPSSEVLRLPPGPGPAPEADQWLNPAGCVRQEPGSLNYTCTTQAGLQRCERLKQQGQVQGCELISRD